MNLLRLRVKWLFLIYFDMLVVAVDAVAVFLLMLLLFFVNAVAFVVLILLMF